MLHTRQHYCCKIHAQWLYHITAFTNRCCSCQCRALAYALQQLAGLFGAEIALQCNRRIADERILVDQTRELFNRFNIKNYGRN